MANLQEQAPEGDFCPLVSKDRTQQKGKMKGCGRSSKTRQVCDQGSRFCSRWMQWYRNYLFQKGDLGAEGPQSEPAERGHYTRAELVWGPNSLLSPCLVTLPPGREVAQWV